MASLEAATERLYAAFARYRLKLDPETMDADEDLDTKKRLKAVRLRALTKQDCWVATHSYCARTEALKHFLPRAVELAAGASGWDRDLEQLVERHQFPTWPDEERTAVMVFLLTRWRSAIVDAFAHPDGTDPAVSLHEISRALTLLGAALPVVGDTTSADWTWLALEIWAIEA